MAWAGNQRAQEQDAQVEGKITGINAESASKKQGTVVRLQPSRIFSSHGKLLRLTCMLMKGREKSNP